MNKISNQFASIEQVTDQYLTRKSTDAVTSSGVSFEDILKQKQDAKAGGTLKFSKHATMRLMIVISICQRNRMNDLRQAFLRLVKRESENR